MTKLEIASHLAALNVILTTVDGDIFNSSAKNGDNFAELWQTMRQAALEAQLIITREGIEELSENLSGDNE